MMGFCSPIAATSLPAHMAFQGDIAEKGISFAGKLAQIL
jgi:hypothetical protein